MLQLMPCSAGSSAHIARPTSLGPHRSPQPTCLFLCSDIAVGTHALISDSTQFKRLGLAVVDEQHK